MVEHTDENGQPLDDGEEPGHSDDRNNYSIDGELSNNELDSFATGIHKILTEMQSEGTVSVGEDDRQHFGKYEIQSWLSRRGQAMVAVAFDPDLERKVVLKIYKHGFSEKHRARLIREGRLLTKIESPNIARCLHVDEINGCLYLVLEYISGQNLFEYKLNNDMTLAHANRIVAKIGKGLKEVHAKGLLHLDLKPQNVMVSSDGQVKLIDFGLAQPKDSIQPGDSSGTPAWLPPEIANKSIDDIGEATDVFGLAGIWFFLLTGQPLIISRNPVEALNVARDAKFDKSRLDSVRLAQRQKRVLLSALSRNLNERPTLPGLISALEHRPRVWALSAVAIIVGLSVLAYGYGNIGKFDVGKSTNLTQPVDLPFENFEIADEVPESIILKAWTAAQLNEFVGPQCFKEFEFRCELKKTNAKAEGSSIEDAQCNQDNVFVFEGAESRSISFSTKKKCYVSIMEYVFDGDSGWQFFDLLHERGGIMKLSPKEDLPPFALPHSPTESGKQDYLVVVASTSPFEISRAVLKMNDPSRSLKFNSPSAMTAFYMFPCLIKAGTNDSQ